MTQKYGPARCCYAKNPYFCGLIQKTERVKHDSIMGVTELKRKGRRNRAIANNKVNAIKQLLRKPIIKNVDVAAIKASFAEKKTA